MKIAILGFGNEGRSLLKFLKKSPHYKKAEFLILDKNPALAGELKKLKLPHRLGVDYLKNLGRFDLIFRSPGIPYHLLKSDFDRLTSATKLFFDEILRHRKTLNCEKPKIIGVTGTKGKGTTCMVICRMLKNAGRATVLAGNIGIPMIDALPQSKKADYVVLELSSFQLQDITISPDIAVIVDVFPDHLDAHKSIAEYYWAKARIGKYQKKSDKIFFFKNNRASARIASISQAKKYPVTPTENNLLKNRQMASAVARACGVSEAIIKKTLAAFHGAEHRLEFVRRITLRRAQGKNQFSIDFYNDSAGTNPIATAAAIQSFKEPIILLAGGREKGLSHKPLADALKKSTVVRVILYGENKNLICNTIRAIAPTTLQIQLVADLPSALRAAYSYAKKIPRPSVILLSPASTSFDMFKNYAERGQIFKNLVKQL